MRTSLICLALMLAACATPPPEPSGIYTKDGVTPEQARVATLTCDSVGRQKFPAKSTETYFMRIEAAQASYQCMTAQGFVRVK